MLMCLKDLGEVHTAETHYHRSVNSYSSVVANTISIVQTIRTCNCSEGKSIIPQWAIST